MIIQICVGSSCHLKGAEDIVALLQQAVNGDSQVLREKALLAARISRQILDGQEVKLP